MYITFSRMPIDDFIWYVLVFDYLYHVVIYSVYSLVLFTLVFLPRGAVQGKLENLGQVLSRYY